MKVHYARHKNCSRKHFKWKFNGRFCLSSLISLSKISLIYDRRKIVETTQQSWLERIYLYCFFVKECSAERIRDTFWSVCDTSFIKLLNTSSHKRHYIIQDGTHWLDINHHLSFEVMDVSPSKHWHGKVKFIQEKYITA